MTVEIDPEQADVVEALQSGRATGSPRPLRRIDTHMSHVFLDGDRVYKLKRRRRLPFADFTALDTRHRLCQAELSVNQALAPSLYERVAAVTRAEDGAIRLDGTGPPLDYVVIMRRFPNGALLDEIGLAGGLTADHVTQAVAAIARFHLAQPPHRDTGHAADLSRILQGLRQTEAHGAGEMGLTAGSERLFDGLAHALARQAPLIEARRKASWVRRGHGDLHLANLCLFEGRVTAFDALEFDPQLATSDVLYDIAFLLMDLRARGLDALANIAMNAYWDATGQDEAALALLPLFTALRAAVRMAVAVEAGDLAKAARYRTLGEDLLRPAPATLIAIGGLSGTGKSTLAKALAPRLPGPCGARVLRSAVIRKARAGVAPGEALPVEAYSPAARADIYHHLAARAAMGLEAGAGVIADATFEPAEARAEIEAAAGRRPFHGLWLETRLATRLARVAARRADASDAGPVVALGQHEPETLAPSWRRCDADGPAEVLAARLAPDLA